jgi:hypothetical protein
MNTQECIVTLLVTVVSNYGVWQASDHRLTSAGRVVLDDAIKHTRLQSNDGRAIIAYAGFGRSINGVHLSEWVRRVLRGARRTLQDDMWALKCAADEVLVPLCLENGIFHTFSIAAWVNGKPQFYLITNRRSKSGAQYIGQAFEWFRQEIPSGQGKTLINLEGSGVLGLPQREVLENLIPGTLRRRHRKPTLRADVGAVLARIVRDASVTLNRPGAPKSIRNTVSRECVVTSLVPPEEAFRSRFFGWAKEAKRPFFQDVMGGHDVNQLMEVLVPHTMPSLQRDLERLKNDQLPEIKVDDNAINEELSKLDWKPSKKL